MSAWENILGRVVYSAAKSHVVGYLVRDFRVNSRKSADKSVIYAN